MVSYAEEASSRYLVDDGTHAHARSAYLEDEQDFDDLYTFYDDVSYHHEWHEVVNGVE